MQFITHSSIPETTQRRFDAELAMSHKGHSDCRFLRRWGSADGTDFLTEERFQRTTPCPHVNRLFPLKSER